MFYFRNVCVIQTYMFNKNTKEKWVGKRLKLQAIREFYIDIIYKTKFLIIRNIYGKSKWHQKK